MPNFSQLTPDYWAAREREWRNEFPGAKFGWCLDPKANMREALWAALRNGREEAIQATLTANPYLIQYAVDRSGHQGIWVFPKQMIKPKGADGTSGFVPDYLIATRSSLGYFWNLVELKRFDVQFANSDGTGYSVDGNKAIAQCKRLIPLTQVPLDVVSEAGRA